jgi:hypothetical protein
MMRELTGVGTASTVTAADTTRDGANFIMGDQERNWL